MTLSLLADKPLFGVVGDGRGIYIFGLEIYYYAIFIVVGMIIATVFSALLMKRRNMSSDFIFLLFIVCIPSAIICARLFYVITDENTSIADFFAFRDGGLSVIGGALGGVLAGFIVCKIKKVPFTRAADCVVINILFAQALGRWGNYFNQEVYGGVVTDTSLQWFPFAVYISKDAQWHYAFFFYEMIINLIGWAILFTCAWFRKKKPNGVLTCLYFVWYGAVRMVMEPLRDPGYILSGGGVPWSELFSILMAGLGVIAILLLLIMNFIREGSFIGSRRGDPCGITQWVTPYKNDPPYFSKINMFGAAYPPKPAKGKKKKKKEQDELNTVELPPEQLLLGDGVKPVHEIFEESPEKPEAEILRDEKDGENGDQEQ